MSSYHRFPALLADIGGTNVRFALLTEARGAPQQVRILACADYSNICAALQAYCVEIGISCPSDVVVAIAGPVTGDVIKMTNHSWRFSITEVRKALNLSRFRVINDFAALALAIPRLTQNDRVQIGCGDPKPRSAIGLIGPGTGLGVSGLVPVGEQAWQPLFGEGGHVSFSSVDSEQDAILQHIRRKYKTVSADRLISGPGLVCLYEALAELAGDMPLPLTAIEISQAALTGTDPLCAKTIDLFCAMLGTAAGNLALTLGAEGGVYIGGGIIPVMLDYFKTSRFRAQFEAKGRLAHYLRSIPTFVITASTPTLLGLATLFDDE